MSNFGNPDQLLDKNYNYTPKFQQFEPEAAVKTESQVGVFSFTRGEKTHFFSVKRETGCHLYGAGHQRVQQRSEAHVCPGEER